MPRKRITIYSNYIYTITHKRIKKYLFIGRMADTRNPKYGYTLIGELYGKPYELPIRDILEDGSNLVITKEEKIDE